MCARVPSEFESQDLYALMQKHNATKFAALDTKPAADQAKLWSELIPGEVGKLEKLLGGKQKYTDSGKTPGELYIFAVMHQIACVKESPGDCPGCMSSGF